MTQKIRDVGQWPTLFLLATSPYMVSQCFQLQGLAVLCCILTSIAIVPPHLTDLFDQLGKKYLVAVSAVRRRELAGCE